MARAANAQRLASTRGRLQLGAQLGDDAIVIAIANNRMTSNRNWVETAGVVENERWRGACRAQTTERRRVSKARLEIDLMPTSRLGATACRTLPSETVTPPSHARIFSSFVTKLKAGS
jgi:hypothetical protein